MITTPLSLLERLRTDRNDDSWRRFVAIYDSWLERIMRKAGIAETDVDDLRQEVLAVVFQELPRFEHNGRPGAFRSWMRSIVMHRVLGYWRSRQSAARQSESFSWQALDDPTAALEEYWDQEHDRHVMGELLKLAESSFSRSTWLAFRRQALDGLRAAAVAAELGMTVNAALLAKSRVMARLRREGRLLLDEI